ncbi:hypothetical protein [Raineya orbicola]|jgi:hypothetical protein|uniref:Outer membrane protein beta-barrel domain n=1 Tax=Raineya orbicola TaxID=2016530 RepID=A0A2N3IJW9_9BACT|nr:hypothetical protein [Raineya orbicola]PKQ70619.1 hypothetical protein Rain11_0349 [Raineya orbicola]
MSKITKILLFLLLSVHLQAQSILEDELTKEFTFGININTNANFPGGISFKYGKVTDNARVNTTYTIEFVGIRHPQEYRFSVSSVSGGQAFVRGKQNYLYNLRLQFGKDLVLFRKAPQEGVQVNAVLAGGLSVGFLKPYMIRYNTSGTGSGLSGNTLNIPFYQYNFGDDALFQNKYGVPFTEERIEGRGDFFAGFEQMKIVPGINAKIGLAFETSAFKTSLTGIETGFVIDIFTQKMPILNANFTADPVKNYSTFAALYLSMFFGGRK